MTIRNLAAAFTLTALTTVAAVAVAGLSTAGAASPTFGVSDTTIEAGGSVTVHLDEPCLHPDGEPQYGNLIASDASSGELVSNQETKGDHMTNGSSGVFTFTEPGIYTITRFCDGVGMLDHVTITVTAPSTTTTSTTSTTAAPATTTTTTAPKGAVTTTTAPKAATTVPTTAAPTTTVAVAVAGVSTVNTATANTTAVGATPVSGSVSYTG